MGKMKGNLQTQGYSLWNIIFLISPLAPTPASRLQNACALTQLNRFLFW